MGVSYDVFTKAFLNKVTEYKFLSLDTTIATELVDSYLATSLSQFNRICQYDLISLDTIARELKTDIPNEDLYEIADIVSEGMIVQWLKPYSFNTDMLTMHINTKDFSTSSQAELLHRTKEVLAEAKNNFTNMMREYSYAHGDLTVLHL